MAEESYPADLRYYTEHDWVRLDGDEGVFGITWFAQDALGEIVYVDLPAEGTEIVAGQTYGELESVKAVTDVYAPMSGVVVEANVALEDEPQVVNEDCYGAGWLVRVKLSDLSESEALMDAGAYTAFLEQD